LEKQYESSKTAFKSLSETLLSEVEENKTKIEEDLISFTMSFFDNNERSLSKVKFFLGK